MARNLTRLGQRIINAITSNNVPGLKWLVDGFNYYDIQRVREVGANRAAAEWIVRCDGKVLLDKFSKEFDDYNTLIRLISELDPDKPSQQVSVLSIDATDSCVSGFGCRHFDGLDKLQSVKFIRCKNLQDFGLETMAQHVASNLSHLTIESCPKITEFGLKHLEDLKNLDSLVLADLKKVYKPERSKQALQNALPNCKVDFQLK